MLDTLTTEISRYVALTSNDIELLKSVAHTQKSPRRTHLLRQGEVSNHLYFITKGLVRAYHTDSKGVDHAVHFAKENEWIGDLGSFINETPACQSVDALENLEYVYLDREDFHLLLQQSRGFERYARLVTQQAFINNEQRMIENLTRSADQRYRSFITNFPELEQRLSLKFIASYLGITPESLSRIRRPVADKA